MATRVGCIFYHLSAFHVTFHQQFEANEASLTMMMLFKPHLEFASKRGNTGIEESPKFLTSKFWFQVNLQGIAILCTGSQNLLRIGRPDSLACGNWNILQNTLLIEKQLNVVFVHHPHEIYFMASNPCKCTLASFQMEENNPGFAFINRSQHRMTRIIGRAMTTMYSKKSIQHMNFQPSISYSTYVTSC